MADHGAYREQWAQRAYFADMQPILGMIGDVDPNRAPHYLAHHIGVWHRGLRSSYNFIALKGSRRGYFSVELKLAEDDPVIRTVPSTWHVAAYDRVERYRVHLLGWASMDELVRLRKLIEQAHAAWTARRPAGGPQ